MRQAARLLRTVALATCAALAACGAPAPAGPAPAGSAPATPASATATGAATTTSMPPTPAASTTPAGPPAGPSAGQGPARGIPANAPWATLYGAASPADLVRMASTFRLIVIDAGRDGGITAADVTLLRSAGARVISYLNVGSCERFRSYWTSAPAGFVPCGADTAAQIGAYAGYPDEVWMNPAVPAYRHLIVDLVAPRLAAAGVDGFFLDNLELVEHGTDTTDGPCDASCAQGGLDLVGALRQRFPAHLIVMQNATGDRTRLGTTGGVPFPSLLDGVSHEQVFGPGTDPEAEHQLLAWRSMGLSPGGQAFSITTEDYVGDCSNRDQTVLIYQRSRADGFSPYATDASAGQQRVCFWGL